MQQQVIINRLNPILEGSQITVTNGDKVIFQKTACGFFHEEIFSRVVDKYDRLTMFCDFITDRTNGDIDKESFEDSLDYYTSYDFSNELRAIIQDDADDTRYEFIYYTL